MNISSINSDLLTQCLQSLNTEKSEATSDVEAQYAVKLINMARQSEAIVGNLLQDTAEISKEAMEKFLSER